MDAVVILVMLASSAPLPLLIIERFLVYPYIVEELVKLILILALDRVKLPKSTRLWTVIGMGLAFTLSESCLYLYNYTQGALLSLFVTRMLLTGSLHVGTFLLISHTSRRGYLGLGLGLCAAILIHFGFNHLIAPVSP